MRHSCVSRAAQWRTRGFEWKRGSVEAMMPEACLLHRCARRRAKEALSKGYTSTSGGTNGFGMFPSSALSGVSLALIRLDSILGFGHRRMHSHASESGPSTTHA